jgi:hypothetical protein
MVKTVKGKSLFVRRGFFQLPVLILTLFGLQRRSAVTGSHHYQKALAQFSAIACGLDMMRARRSSVTFNRMPASREGGIASPLSYLGKMGKR